MLPVVVVGCNRADRAPDCFEVDDDGVCVIPTPGDTGPVGLSIDCEMLSATAVGAQYNHIVDVEGDSGMLSDWSAENLPPGLEMVSGAITGVATNPGTYDDIQITVFDAGFEQTLNADCGPIEVNDPLNANGLQNNPDFPFACIDITSGDTIDDIIAGGTGATITCSITENPGAEGCPNGQGNGVLPDGITFDAESCTFTGTPSTPHHGTWVFGVDVTQSGFTTMIPHCYVDDKSGDVFHDISQTDDGDTDAALSPGVIVFDVDSGADVEYGNGAPDEPNPDPLWEVTREECEQMGNLDCDQFGLHFSAKCSPFDNDYGGGYSVRPFGIIDQGDQEVGFFHGFRAAGPNPAEEFRYRPWISNWQFWYCTNSDGAVCDTDNPDFRDNAQTQHTWSVIGFPTLPVEP